MLRHVKCVDRCHNKGSARYGRWSVLLGLAFAGALQGGLGQMTDGSTEQTVALGSEQDGRLNIVTASTLSSMFFIILCFN